MILNIFCRSTLRGLDCTHLSRRKNMTPAFQKWTLMAGQVIARYSVGLFFLTFGAAKFTSAEAAAIHPLLVHSPFLFWLPRLFDQQVSSNVIGVVEIILALMMASRPFAPRISA